MIDFETKLDIRNALAKLTPAHRAIARKVMENEALTNVEQCSWDNAVRPKLSVSLDGVL